jgi:hypothetical protein
MKTKYKITNTKLRKEENIYFPRSLKGPVQVRGSEA